MKWNDEDDKRNISDTKSTPSQPMAGSIGGTYERPDRDVGKDAGGKADLRGD